MNKSNGGMAPKPPGTRHWPIASEPEIHLRVGHGGAHLRVFTATADYSGWADSLEEAFEAAKRIRDSVLLKSECARK